MKKAYSYGVSGSNWAHFDYLALQEFDAGIGWNDARLAHAVIVCTAEYQAGWRVRVADHSNAFIASILPQPSPVLASSCS